MIKIKIITGLFANGKATIPRDAHVKLDSRDGDFMEKVEEQ